MPSVYLAGPDVFLSDAIEIGRRKTEMCAAYGFEGLYPLDNEISPTTTDRVDRLIYQANKAMMETSRRGQQRPSERGDGVSRAPRFPPKITPEPRAEPGPSPVIAMRVRLCTRRVSSSACACGAK